ncbi:serine hydrolase [Paenibacillus sp. SYP-B3998]|uniref:Serine hydrolase n=1 Tax=Paenibacillus sp. SYP-B3998 TaxID=2678564 RepID=A0A6G3ZZC0_9BACL|nr:serine hydrolase [Paenibacillus sp. SYP-B3998]NEW07566.1 serine hydrolase [Paenibacillus sp. SYP-B3998]
MKRGMKVVMVMTICTLSILSGCSQTQKASSNLVQEKGKAASYVWKEALPKDMGMDEVILNQMDSAVESKHTRTYSVLIVRNGHIVFEKYYHNKTRNTPTGVFSVTKSVLSALTGIAIEKGYVKNVDQKISDFLPQVFSDVTDSRKKEITIKQALSMTGGLESVDNTIGVWFQSPDWNMNTINKPLRNEPGSKFEYNTGLPHLLSGVLTKATGMSTEQFANKYLFGPLDITNYEWSQDPQGITSGGTRLSLTPRDMAKLGYLYLHEGEWEGQPIVSKKWVQASIHKQVEVDANTDYGYLFWLPDVKDKNGKKVFAFEANGYGGQYIRVIPEWNLVVVMTSNPDSSANSSPEELMRTYIYPSIKS